MKKTKRTSLIGVALVALILLVIVFLTRLTLRRHYEVALPETDDTQGESVLPEAGQESIRRVEVTPETVQLVIERLARPDNYRREMEIERFWTDGSGKTTVTVQTADGWTRADITAGDGATRHVITGDGKSWIWYDGAKVYSGAASLTADEEQSIPTYEDILSWNKADIAAADYRTRDEVNCIYVETRPDSSGYAERSWVSVESGLLVAAERLNGEDVVYRMTGFAVEEDGVTAEAFTLPDGTALHDTESEG